MKNLLPDEISNTFGYKSELAKKTIGRLCNHLKNTNSSGRSIYIEWEFFFNEIGGYKDKKIIDHIYELAGFYSIETNIDPLQILFVFQTYYSIIARWLTYKFVNTKIQEQKISEYYPEKIEKYFKSLGITNFGKTFYFDWCFNNFNSNLGECYQEIITGIKKTINNNQFDKDTFSVDIMQNLYQNLFPPKIRHFLGEYYTPRWLVELVISNSGYEYNPESKIIDPACGSGSFLLNIINGFIDKNNTGDNLIEKVLDNIIGLDLNPIAVLSTKANYILAIKEFLPLKTKRQIPVFHFDAVLNKDCMDKSMPREKKLRLKSGDSPSLLDNKFDYIFGNPPWINWKFLPDFYKSAVLPLADKYNLFKHKGLKARLGFAQDDICVILTYSVIDQFLKKNGILSFVLPQTLFKTYGGGEGFRQFKLGHKGDPFQVLSVIDLSKLQIFDSSASKAAIFTCMKGNETEYPVRYEIITRKDIHYRQRINRIEKSRNDLESTIHYAEPVNDPVSNWITADKDVLQFIKKIISPSDYKARAGVCTWASSIYWIEILEKKGDLYKIKNYNGIVKYKSPEIIQDIESDFIFPLIRGRNISRWHFENDLNIILPQSKEKPYKAIEEKDLKSQFPNLYGYFLKNKKFLENRKGYKKFLSDSPFYSIYDIGRYTFSRYKVVWKYIDNDMRAVSFDSTLGEKPFIPDLNVMMIPVNSPEEAHYLSACLNSSLIRLIIHTFGLCTRITGGIMKSLPIKKFDPGNKLHQKLAEYSLESHKYYYDNQILNNQLMQIDQCIKEIHHLEESVLTRIQEDLNSYIL